MYILLCMCKIYDEYNVFVLIKGKSDKIKSN